METLKYKVIKTESQYFKYCDTLEGLVETGSRRKAIQDEIELLTLLIEKWDDEHSRLNRVDPIRLLKSLMQEHKWKATTLAEFLGISKGYVSEILNYKKGLSKHSIRKLANRFKVRQEAFNRPYELKPGTAPEVKTATIVKKKRSAAA